MKALPADESALAELKKDQAEAKKRLGEIDRVSKREKPNLITATKSLENFQSTMELIGVDFGNLSLNDSIPTDVGKGKLMSEY